MSISSSFLVFLLCLSLHACTARPLAALHVSAQNNEGTQKLEDADQVKFKTVEKGKESTTSGAVGTSKAVVSVSWRVPHWKRGEKHPGFNLDYSPPKTHPPSHN